MTKLRRRRFQLYRTTSIVDQRSPEHPPRTDAGDGPPPPVPEVTVSINNEDVRKTVPATEAATDGGAAPHSSDLAVSEHTVLRQGKAVKPCSYIEV